MKTAIFSSDAIEELMLGVSERLPFQSRGIFASDKSEHVITRSHFLGNNSQRTAPEVDTLFQQYGKFYTKDRGFYSSPEELMALHRVMKERKQQMAGIFHVHLLTPPIPSKIDIDLCRSHIVGYANFVYSIVSLITGRPEIRSFQIKENTVDEIEMQVIGSAEGAIEALSQYGEINAA